jgi:hypothetical protein
MQTLGQFRTNHNNKSDLFKKAKKFTPCLDAQAVVMFAGSQSFFESREQLWASNFGLCSLKV